MTTVAAVQGDGWVVMGYDSNVAEEGGRKYALPAGAGKVFDNAGYLFGVAGDFRAINILAHSFHPPDPGGKTGPELDRFMVSRFIPALKTCFDKAFFGKDQAFESVLLVAVNGVAYEIGGDYSCLRDDRGFYALGTGSAFALGALAALLGNKERTVSGTKRHMTTAVGIAISFDPGSARPVSCRVQEGP